MLGAAAAAWVSLNLWQPASVHYVQDKVDQTIKAFTGRLDSVEGLALQNRLDTLTQQRQAIEREKFERGLQVQTAKDPVAKNVLSDRLRAVEIEGKTLDETITDTKAELKKIKAR